MANDVKAILSVHRRRRRNFALICLLISIVCTVFLPFNPSRTPARHIRSYKSHFYSLLSRVSPNSRRTCGPPPPLPSNTTEEQSQTQGGGDHDISRRSEEQAQMETGLLVSDGETTRNDSISGHDILNSNGAPSGKQIMKPDHGDNGNSSGDLARQQTQPIPEISVLERAPPTQNQTQVKVDQESLNLKGTSVPNQKQHDPKVSESKGASSAQNRTHHDPKVSDSKGAPSVQNQTQIENDFSRSKGAVVPVRNETTQPRPEFPSPKAIPTVVSQGLRTWEELAVSLKQCNIFEGTWVSDESYPLYSGGSCPLIDEPFDCFLNGRPEHAYQKLRWKPNDCDIPRLNASDMLETLRGKRLVFVGDSLNRNMWESLVCLLRNSVENKTKVFEASGQREFRAEGSYSFVFEDYHCSIEFFRSNFLVEEWEFPGPNGTKKETLRLDLIEKWSSDYKNAEVIVFNTGHWWTHEKTMEGKDYYQEGSHVHAMLDVNEAFRRALTTWGRWVDRNINPNKTLIFFRGYSSSHFSGGQWNSGGACDGEKEPIKNETYLEPYPPMMNVLEKVLEGMKMQVNYMNITTMSDYRKDAHPSIYQKQNLTEEERRSPEKYQDCSHWCLPGVPDIWNELLYAQLLMRLKGQQ